MASNSSRSPRGSSCAHCLNPPAMTDIVGFKWCEKHRMRGDLINLGARSGYPHLMFSPYAIAKGKAAWIAVIIIGEDRMIAQALEHMQIPHESP